MGKRTNKLTNNYKYNVTEVLGENRKQGMKVIKNEMTGMLLGMWPAKALLRW